LPTLNTFANHSLWYTAVSINQGNAVLMSEEALH